MEKGIHDIGMIGLGVMGRNLALNIESHGFSVIGYDIDASKREEVKAIFSGKKIAIADSLPELIVTLKRPHIIMMMVPAGKPVDDVIQLLSPHLKRRTVLIDGGNSFFMDTERRSKELETAGIWYIGTGVSGGEYGALHGPSLMPGGQEEAYRHVEPIFTAIAARTDDGPCCTYVGPGGAGHYVKMVHNGIEYGDMQLIAEAYFLLKNALELEAPQLQEIFAEWNQGVLNSYLIDITAKILGKIDPETDKPIVDVILDKAGQKGTGKWTSQNALDVGVAIPTINSAVEARILSAFNEERVTASKVLHGSWPGSDKKFEGNADTLIAAVHDALYASKITSYAQGLALLRAASVEYDYHLNLAEITRIWKGGCIIRAKLLDDIKQAFLHNPDLPNLLLDAKFADTICRLQDNWRLAVQTAVNLGIPMLATAASLAYFDSYRCERLPANLIQAQRDFFGAHTYERVDKPGSFHTRWEE
ncbi:phosphogluconate dehydrogenase (NADP(+)-dependent, decarboxylating) [candidate division KSB1 bacterium]|nr:MAG: phosphogluconate dehydrogenase (NADP(+)-dependent, decarboxylating) [candidate division KSB1 bacterium]